MNSTYLDFTEVCDEKTGCRYKVSILQNASDEITMILKNSAGVERFYLIPVKKCAGMVWKVNKKSISNDTGNAPDAIRFFVNPDHDAYLCATIRELIFSGNVKPV